MFLIVLNEDTKHFVRLLDAWHFAWKFYLKPDAPFSSSCPRTGLAWTSPHMNNLDVYVMDRDKE